MPAMRTSRTIPAVSLALAVATLTVVAPSAQARDYRAVRLADIRATGHWSGSVTGGATADPAACTPQACDSVPVTVRLPRGTWRSPGGMLVAIQWSKDKWLEPGYDLNLYVYDPAGRLVGRSDSLADSHAEAVWVDKPVNGTYTVKVVPYFVADTAPLGYAGVISFARGRTLAETSTFLGGSQPLTLLGTDFPRHPRPMLPDLVPGAPTTSTSPPRPRRRSTSASTMASSTSRAATRRRWRASMPTTRRLPACRTPPAAYGSTAS